MSWIQTVLLAIGALVVGVAVLGIVARSLRSL